MSSSICLGQSEQEVAGFRLWNNFLRTGCRIGYNSSIIPSRLTSPLLFSHVRPYVGSSVSFGDGFGMLKITFITPGFAVAGGLQGEDIAEIAAAGFKSILSNLPDGESSRYLAATDEGELACRAGLGFRYVPTTKADVFSDRVLQAVSTALTELEGPVLAHCASGLRSALVWAAAASQSQPADCVITVLKKAGYDLEPVREELEEQRGRGEPGNIPEALDCHCEPQD
jgi:uncharacterized protein (TIGR01244 family)